ncbi:hypothetical protein O5D80_001436 [Batrachochytrium dendrobatidis]|nr:hypothetical protein O5D80_001436 [Batrachochytrium dendrobatidis]
MSDTTTILVSLVLLFFVVRYVLFGGQTQPPGSNVTRQTVTSRRGRFPVPLSSVDAVFSMFPHIPRATIELDLSNTGSVEETCDRILSGALVAPVTPVPVNTSQARVSTASTPASSLPVFTNKPPPYLKSELEVVAEPLKKWEPSPDARQLSLRQRKEFMVQQARR